MTKYAFVFSMIIASTAFAGSWRDNPVVYGISPYYVAKDQPEKAFRAMRRRIPEIKYLGANVIWLMPITPPSEPGHGYDVIDHRSIWSELGTETEFRDF